MTVFTVLPFLGPQVKDGKVIYANKFVQSEYFKANMADYPAFRTFAGERARLVTCRDPLQRPTLQHVTSVMQGRRRSRPFSRR